MKHLLVAILAVCAACAHAGELKKDYFGATKPGDWVAQVLSSPDGSKSEYTSKRLADEDGHVALELSVKVIAGAGAGAESKNIIVLPKDFNFARDFLSYAKSTEKMTMMFGSTVMPVDPTTLKAIKDSSKDYRGAVTFETTETIDGHTCDRYAYAIAIGGPAPAKETGKLWLDATLPFGIVRQDANSINGDGTGASSYTIKLTETGHEQLEGAVSEPEPVKVSPPSVVTIVDGYNAGRVALDITVASGRNLNIVLRNKTDAPITINVPAGNIDITGSSPVEDFKIAVAKAAEIALDAGASSDPVPATQRGTRGPIEGTFTLSTYEGTPLYSGSVTVGTLK